MESTETCLLGQGAGRKQALEQQKVYLAQFISFPPLGYMLILHLSEKLVSQSRGCTKSNIGYCFTVRQSQSHVIPPES